MSEKAARKAVYQFLNSLSECHKEYAGVCATYKRDVLGPMKGEEFAKWCKIVVRRMHDAGIVDGANTINYEHAKNIINPNLSAFKNLMPKSKLDFCHVWQISVDEEVRQTICAHLNNLYKKLSPVSGNVIDPNSERVKQMVLGANCNNDPKKKVFADLIDDITANFGEREPDSRDLQEIISSVESKMMSGQLGIESLLSMAEMVGGAVEKSGGSKQLSLPGFGEIDIGKVVADYKADPEKIKADQEELLRRGLEPD